MQRLGARAEGVEGRQRLVEQLRVALRGLGNSEEGPPGGLAPFLVGIVSSILHRPSGHLFDFDLLTPFLFVITAAVCWTGVAVWLVMR